MLYPAELRGRREARAALPCCGGRSLVPTSAKYPVSPNLLQADGTCFAESTAGLEPSDRTIVRFSFSTPPVGATRPTVEIPPQAVIDPPR